MKFIKNKLKNMDASVIKVTNTGLKICFVLLLFSTLILITYHNFQYSILFYTGISLFKSTLFFISFFIICAIAIDTIKNENNF